MPENPATNIRRRLLLGGLGGTAVVAGGLAATAWWQTRPVDAPAVGYVRMDGTPAQLADLSGQVVLVNFWATTCVICRQEMPALVALHRRHERQGYRTLSVAMQYDPPAAVVNYLADRPLPFEVTLDNTGAIARAFGGIVGTPTSLLIDRAGRIVWRHEGAPDFVALDLKVRDLLARPSS
ncbi:TlpA disulfide reductase family protein [Sphaerotilus mobilis]|uniref:Thiol-disulfide isomerase/thioredoxin n=1 Tax=Sphaerotilus mobilis TaxID=47994 RepID=A0A4Q7LJZ5_9BURK|nr:TlpA disulfide reductase family protein [Sphaerotilus mobilis]RZS54965.1 thiol-disulfide isomerase/thioredoxin [Sphaerotilus mobilis]